VNKRPFLYGCAFGLVVYHVLIALFLGGLYVFRDALIARTSANLKPPPIAANERAAYDWTVWGPTDEAVSMTEFTGKPLFLHIWSPGCFTCQAELPGLNRLYGRIDKDAVAFVAVAMGDAEELPALHDKYGLEFPLYRSKDALPEVFVTSAAPATFIIAPDGDVVFKHVGGAQWDADVVVGLLASLAVGADDDSPSDEAGVQEAE